MIDIKAEKIIIKGILPLLWIIGVVTIAASVQDDPAMKTVDAFGQKLKQQMQRSTHSIEEGDYHSAQAYTDQIVQNLEQLIEALMPLDERIERLLRQEKEILSQTQSLQKSLSSAPSMQNEMDMDEVIRRQQDNLKATDTASQIALQQSNEAKPSQGAGKESPRRVISSETLQEVSGLLDRSRLHQTEAANHLLRDRLPQAEKEEQKAIASLEKALEKLRKQSNPQQRAQSNQHPPKGGQQKQAPGQEQSDSASPQKGNQPPANPAEPQKMDAQQALKQLYKLRKEANDELERRRRAYGVAPQNEQVPVEKDW